MTARGLLLTALALLAFASNSLLTRAAVGAHLINPLAFGGLRFASGALLIGLIALRRARPWGGSWSAALALLGYVVPFSLGYGRVGAGVGSLLLFGSVQATMIARGLVAGHRPSVREWTGLALAIAGLLALVLPGARAPDGLGALFMILAGVAWGAYSLLGRGARDPVAATADNFVRLLPASLLLAVWGLSVQTPAVPGVLLALASGALASGLGYIVWYAALPHLTPSRAAIVQLAVPPIAALGGVLFLGESLSLRLAGCGAAILGGVALALTGRR
jgi:drug/metabolite transporter (DMT)-like permease